MVDKKLTERALEAIKSGGQARVDELWRSLGVSRTTIHKSLKVLLRDGKIARVGRAPLVFYVYINGDIQVNKPKEELPAKISKILEDTYLYVTPLGEVLSGEVGFSRWVEDIKQTNQYNFLVREYVKTRSEADSYRNRYGYINATSRIKGIYSDLKLERVYYLDFYSLPKYGKTRLGQLVLFAKQAQKFSLIDEIVPILKTAAMNIIKRKRIDAVSFIPPTVPRKVQLQKELEKRLDLKLPVVELKKAYLGDIPVAQKTLSKLEERVKNASGSIYLKDINKKYRNILLIDDEVGSGATFQETARKMLDTGVAKKVFGLAIVGSYKGFDVIKEI